MSIRIKKRQKNPQIKTREIEKTEEKTENIKEKQESLENLKEIKKKQRIRKRKKGIDTGILTSEDAKKLGLVPHKIEKENSKYGLKKREPINLDTQFTAQTDQVDMIHAEMMKFVDNEMKKDLNVLDSNSKKDEIKNNKNNKNTDDLSNEIYNYLPKYLMTESFLVQQNDDLGLTGIQEVEMPDVKIQNIEQTEKAKRKLMELQKKKKNKGSRDYVPVNYHSFILSSLQKKKKEKKEEDESKNEERKTEKNQFLKKEKEKEINLNKDSNTKREISTDGLAVSRFKKKMGFYK
ncbi:telomere length and silencing protein 1 tls1 family member [Anaeramoeba ignava]|uniref:Telomere length and silencing protein 1 tls1 family member n=1 Tax=Anaeramoeba ignava TaxID=1746090 RepID=A0A9Q0R5E9_ANAIG|nr:telomere length and silencing protein 1 tls1 family member [Anaeramoeba ignava]